eukprot:jgi/Bigna1/72090/fgenesh1_pg.18_\
MESWSPDVSAREAKELQDWIARVTHEKVPSFIEGLKSGQVLCKLINTIKQGSVHKDSIHIDRSPMNDKENLKSYLTSCKKLGMKDEELFTPENLYEETNIQAVVDHLYRLGTLIKDMESYRGPKLNPKFAIIRHDDYSDVMPECAACGLPGRSGVILGGKRYHEKCVVCHECKNPIGGNYHITKEGHILDTKCWNAKHVAKCVVCNEPALSQKIVAGKIYHPQCFVCTECGKPIEKTYFNAKNGGFLHPECWNASNVVLPEQETPADKDKKPTGSCCVLQ